MNLVHISDLHCGSRFDKDAFNTAADEINALCPEAIIITGDLTEEGYLKEYLRVKEMIEKFKCGGKVGHRQILMTEKILSEYPDKFKIVGMHHHLIPVPDTGMETNTVHDARDVLRPLTQIKADLVLCGHRHRPWLWNIDNMQVIHAGTLSCDKFRGFYANSYNIINIRGSKIDAKVKIVGGETLGFDKILGGYKNLD